jgi:hypothetical protein
LDGEQFLHAVFGQQRKSMRDGKRTNHGILEGSHCLVVFYVEKEACVPVKMGCKPVVFSVEEMTQEPCEGYCENSLGS